MPGLAGAFLALKRRRLYRRVLRGAARILILRYHSVGDPGEVARYLDPALSIPPARFREQISLLRRRFRIATMDDALARVRGESEGPPLAVLTFDDGYADNHDVALPILRSEGATACFYVTTGPLLGRAPFWISELWRLAPRLPRESVDLGEGRVHRFARGGNGRRELTSILAAMRAERREVALEALARTAGVPRGEGLEGSFLSPDQARALAAAGMEVGAHTRTHPHLDRLEEGAAEELEGSRRDLEAVLGAPVRHLAYPNPGGGGINDAPVREAARAAGYASAVTSVPGPISAGTDPWGLPRVGVYAGEQERVLFRVLAAAAP